MELKMMNEVIYSIPISVSRIINVTGHIVVVMDAFMYVSVSVVSVYRWQVADWTGASECCRDSRQYAGVPRAALPPCNSA